MSIECSECERDARGGHAPDCSRNPLNAKPMLHSAVMQATTAQEFERVISIMRMLVDAGVDWSQDSLEISVAIK